MVAISIPSLHEFIWTETDYPRYKSSLQPHARSKRQPTDPVLIVRRGRRDDNESNSARAAQTVQMKWQPGLNGATVSWPRIDPK
jgi:hypothetical protein